MLQVLKTITTKYMATGMLVFFISIPSGESSADTKLDLDWGEEPPVPEGSPLDDNPWAERYFESPLFEAKPETREEIDAYKKALIAERLEAGPDGEPIMISSLEELAEYARKSNVYVKMKPGTYELTLDNYRDFISAAWLITFRRGGNNSVRRWMSLIEFEGESSRYELDGVKIKFDTRIFNAPMPDEPLSIIYVNGDNHIIRGLELEMVTPGPYTREEDWNKYHRRIGLNPLLTRGDYTLIQDVKVTTRGSTPYGYGDLLGKGAGAFARLAKMGGPGLTGHVGGAAVDVEVVVKSYGHAQTLSWYGEYIDCEWKAETRMTDEILEEESGLAYENDFVNFWRRQSDDPRIKPGKMISLAEEAFRTYRNWVHVKALGCKVSGTRASMGLHGAPGSEVFFSNHTAERVTLNTFMPGSGARIVNSKADIRYSPAINTSRADNVEADITILPSSTDESVIRHRLWHYLKDFDVNPKLAAYICGRDHKIILRAKEDLQLREDDPHYIMIGPMKGARAHRDARNVKLVNRTGLPILFSERSYGCTVWTNGPVVEDRGEGNTVKQIR